MSYQDPPPRLHLVLLGRFWEATIVSFTGEILGRGTGLEPPDALLNAAAMWAGLRVLPRVPLEPGS
jgi:hypothetical protein